MCQKPHRTTLCSLSARGRHIHPFPFYFQLFPSNTGLPTQLGTPQGLRHCSIRRYNAPALPFGFKDGHVKGFKAPRRSRPRPSAAGAAHRTGTQATPGAAHGQGDERQRRFPGRSQTAAARSRPPGASQAFAPPRRGSPRAQRHPASPPPRNPEDTPAPQLRASPAAGARCRPSAGGRPGRRRG